MSTDASFFQNSEEFFQEEQLGIDSSLLLPDTSGSAFLTSSHEELLMTHEPLVQSDVAQLDIQSIVSLENAFEGSDGGPENEVEVPGAVRGKESKESQEVLESKRKSEEEKMSEELYYVSFETLAEYAEYFRKLGKEEIVKLREKASVTWEKEKETPGSNINSKIGELYYKAGLASFYNDKDGLSNRETNDFWEGNHFFSSAIKHKNHKAYIAKATLIFHNRDKISERAQFPMEEAMVNLLLEDVRKHDSGSSHFYLGFCAFENIGIKKEMLPFERMTMAKNHLERAIQIFDITLNSNSDSNKRKKNDVNSLLTSVNVALMRMQKSDHEVFSSPGSASESIGARFIPLQPQSAEQQVSTFNGFEAAPSMAYGASGTHFYMQQAAPSFMPMYQTLSAGTQGAGSGMPMFATIQQSNASSAIALPAQQAVQHSLSAVEPSQQVSAGKGKKRKLEKSVKAVAKTTTKTKRKKKKQKTSH